MKFPVGIQNEENLHWYLEIIIVSHGSVLTYSFIHYFLFLGIYKTLKLYIIQSTFLCVCMCFMILIQVKLICLTECLSFTVEIVIIIFCCIFERWGSFCCIWKTFHQNSCPWCCSNTWTLSATPTISVLTPWNLRISHAAKGFTVALLLVTL